VKVIVGSSKEKIRVISLIHGFAMKTARGACSRYMKASGTLRAGS